MHTAVIPDYGTFTYGYAGDLLTTVTFLGEQQGATLQTKIYVYEDPNFSYLLTGIVDESGERFATWSYDMQGRAVSSEHGQLKEKITLQYDSETQTTTFNAFGKETVYTLKNFNGLTQITHLEAKQSPNCDLANQSFTYFADGALKN